MFTICAHISPKDALIVTLLSLVPRNTSAQAMGWFADSMRLRDVIGVVSSIEIPLPGLIDADQSDAGDNRGAEAAWRVS